MNAAHSTRTSAATDQAARAALLYERHHGRILGFCRSRLPSFEEAEDAAQHTFLNAYRSLRSGVVPYAETAWLFKIAENVCHERRRSAWRRSRVEIVSDDGELGGGVAAPQRSNDELSGLVDALAELTPNQRRAILLREWQGLSYNEIAGELEVSQAAVETLLFRARRSLVRKVDGSPAPPRARHSASGRLVVVRGRAGRLGRSAHVALGVGVEPREAAGPAEEVAPVAVHR